LTQLYLYQPPRRVTTMLDETFNDNDDIFRKLAAPEDEGEEDFEEDYEDEEGEEEEEEDDGEDQDDIEEEDLDEDDGDYEE